MSKQKQKAKFELSPTQLINLSKVVLQNGKPLISKEILCSAELDLEMQRESE